MSDLLREGQEAGSYDPQFDNAMIEKITSNESLPIRLRRQLVQSQKETARLKRLIELLEENPATNEILQLLGKHY